MPEENQVAEKKDNKISLVSTMPFYDDAKPGRKGWWEESIGEQRLMALRNAFMLGATDKEACYLAGIPVDALYRYTRANPEFQDEKDRLKLNTVIKARQIVLGAMARNPEMAWKYLERKLPEEFGAKDTGNNVLINNGNIQQNVLTPDYFQLRDGDNLEELLEENAEHRTEQE